MIRPVVKEDAPMICDIYNYYVENTVITFEENPVDADEMGRRIQNITETHPWIVFEEEGLILAYAYASPWRVKSAYRFSAELTVYADVNHRGKKIGSTLYTALIKKMEEMGKHCLYGVIAVPNEASDKLHKRLGFTKCGHFHQVGYKFGKWVDVSYWERLSSELI